jgi:hypothetical protein
MEGFPGDDTEELALPMFTAVWTHYLASHVEADAAAPHGQM